MCAIRDGQSVGSTMGFTALDGLPMGTRCGQLDPGVVLYLAANGMPPAEIEDLLYRRSGLKGLSGLSQDMRELEAAGTPQAQQAIAYFVSRIRRELGAMAAILSGLDAVVFCGGIGENAWRIRDRVCRGFEWLGIELDEMRNQTGEMIISSDRSRVRVFIIHTNEEMMIAATPPVCFAARSAEAKPSAVTSMRRRLSGESQMGCAQLGARALGSNRLDRRAEHLYRRIGVELRIEKLIEG